MSIKNLMKMTQDHLMMRNFICTAILKFMRPWKTAATAVYDEGS